MNINFFFIDSLMKIWKELKKGKEDEENEK